MCLCVCGVLCCVCVCMCVCLFVCGVCVCVCMCVYVCGLCVVCGVSVYLCVCVHVVCYKNGGIGCALHQTSFDSTTNKFC